MADPLSTIAREHNATKPDDSSNKLDAKLLNELDDLENNVIVSPSPSKSSSSTNPPQSKPTPKQKHAPRAHSQSNAPWTSKQANHNGHNDGNNSNKKPMIRTHSVFYPNGVKTTSFVHTHNTLNALHDNDDDDDLDNNEGNDHANDSNLPLTNNHSTRNRFEHETHTLKQTVVHGLFEDEYEGYGKLHNESAMLHCTASYFLTEDQLVEGEIHLTNFLLYFLPKSMEEVPGGITHLIIPIASIAKISEQQRSNNFTEIVIMNRIYRSIRFRFAADKEINYISSDKVLQMLRALTFPNRMIDLFAFEYCKRHPSHSKLTKLETPSTTVDNTVTALSTDVWGWDIYDVEQEFNRMGIFLDTSSLHPTPQPHTHHISPPASPKTFVNDEKASKSSSNMSPFSEHVPQKRHRQYTSSRIPKTMSSSKDDHYYPRYRFTTINRGFEICDSYPELLVVPSSITDWELQQVARFRRLGRIPVLTWKPRNSNVALFRCSQPKVGMASNRSRADEHLIQSIAEANPIDNSILYIMDARPKLNARVNKMKGAGFENTNFYKNIKLEFLNIDNIHIMRKSRKALAALIHSHSNLRSSKDKEWLQSLGSTEWLTHIRELLKGTYSMIRVLTKLKYSVLCHCSDGWDRTSQLCCLVQLCLDSYYRTMKGFIVLVCKDWLSFGHQFDKRCGHRKDDSFEEDERSPIFEQFIECVWQLLEQYPLYFEFNENFLICILDHLYSCKYGTFLCDKLKERKQFKLSQRTLSLWTHVQNCSNSQSFINIYYTPTKKQLTPKYSLKILKFWSSWHFRNCPEHILKSKPMFEDNGRQQIDHLMSALKEENERLLKELEILRSNKLIVPNAVVATTKPCVSDQAW
eukprot:CAMPEP_0197041802 /NCGR_PEP_ID=MMETSP1384-20130603/18285_1 /TAXON_ID=29189 /ORGANISM="Ammonia sp." /LENGTH=861 /DNA_ID=CAMNT_0042472785 /DNA_START=12 /DNA_END=2594 /DNA_ORIENTATION=+